MRRRFPPMRAGQRYGMLVALHEVEGSTSARRIWWFACDCGNETAALVHSVNQGLITSCKCKRRSQFLKHGDYKSPEHQVWGSMNSRCNNPNHPSYKEYGGRGIFVCDAWRGNYEAFLSDMGRRPTADHQLDRIDNNGPYSPGNCRWATRSENSSNRRNTRLYTHGNETMTLAGWSARTGFSYQCLRKRLDAGWPLERALTAPKAGAKPAETQAAA